MGADEMVEIPLQLDKDTADTFWKMPKKELVERLCSSVLEAKVYKLRCQTAIEDVDKANREIAELQTKLDKAESYVEQGRAMIEAVMQRWYEYDV